MRFLRQVFVVLVLLATVPVLAQEATEAVTLIAPYGSNVELIDGSTPPAPIVVEVPNTGLHDDLYWLIGFLIAIAPTAYIALREVTQTRDVVGAFASIMHKVLEAPGFYERTKATYDNLTGAQRAGIDMLLSLGDLITELTPDERDDFVREWTAKVRAKREAQAQAQTRSTPIRPSTP